MYLKRYYWSTVVSNKGINYSSTTCSLLSFPFPFQPKLQLYFLLALLLDSKLGAKNLQAIKEIVLSENSYIWRDVTVFSDNCSSKTSNFMKNMLITLFKASCNDFAKKTMTWCHCKKKFFWNWLWFRFNISYPYLKTSNEASDFLSKCFHRYNMGTHGKLRSRLAQK